MKIKANMKNMSDLAMDLETTVNKIFGGYLGQPLFYDLQETGYVSVSGHCVLQKKYPSCEYNTKGEHNQCYNCKIYQNVTGDYSGDR